MIDRENLKDFFSSQYYRDNKKELVKFVANELGIKEASARRNINRIEAYYLEKNIQKRSGARTYINLIAKYNSLKLDIMYSVGADFVAVFPDYEKALLYQDGLETILHIRYSDKFETVILRYYMP